MTILVTGATGLVGGEVVRSLLREGAKVRAGVRDAQKKESAALRELGAEVVELDFARAETFAPALHGVSKVFYLIVPSPADATFEPVFIAAMKEAGVQHVVKLSVWKAGEEAYLFARMHRQSEQRLEESGIAWTFLRPSGFMQNLLQLSGTIRSANSFFLPMGQAAVGHIDARDIADVAAKVLLGNEHHGKSYDLSGPEALTYDQVASSLTEVTGRPIHYVPTTAEQWRGTMQGYGVPGPVVEGLLDLYGYYVSGGSNSVSPAVSDILGRPARSLADYVKQNAGAFSAAAH